MKYKCDDCESVFEGSSYVNKCKDCNGTNISQNNDNDKGGGIWWKEFLIKNKWYILATLFFFLLIVINPGEGGGDGEGPVERFNLVFKVNPDNSVSLTLKGEDGISENYNKRIHKWLGLNIKLIDNNGDMFLINSKNNKFYSCEDGDMVFNWNKSSNRLNGIYSSVFNKTFVIKGSECSDCCTPLLQIKNVSIANKRTCDIKIDFNMPFNANIMVSINGKSGTYKNKNIWDFEENIEVWAYIKDAPKVLYNGPTLPPCDPPKKISDADKERIKMETIVIIGDLITNAANPLDSYWDFYDRNPNMIVKINNKRHSLSNLGGDIDNYQQEGKSLIIKDVIIDSYGLCSEIYLTY